MRLVHPSLISKIDKYASENAGMDMTELMRRAGDAVARAVRELVPVGARIAVFAGKGNNGGDGYAAATMLLADYDVTLYDVFSSGQRTAHGKYYLDRFISLGGTVIPLNIDNSFLCELVRYDLIVDAVFGTGFTDEPPEIAVRLSELFSSLKNTKKVAIDVPLLVNAADGSVIDKRAYRADVTVVLGFIKTGLVSYPAKEYVGKLIYDNIGLHNSDIIDNFDFTDYYIDYELARTFIPNRLDNSNKGTFGKCLLVSGSHSFVGAAHLSVEAALRGGAGYVTYVGEDSLCASLVQKFPEVIYKTLSISNPSDADLRAVLDLSDRHTAILVGPGSSKSDGLYKLVRALLITEGAPLILDADAINVVADNIDEGRELIRNSKRRLILTPHPLEFSRISGIPIDTVQANRLSVAKSFAKENNCTLVLKGAATVVTDGYLTYINSSGSSALAKAGSGDVLSGFLASLVASGVSPISACALAVFIHGLAADVLKDELSELGVTPSDLPREMARQLSCIQNEKGK